MKFAKKYYLLIINKLHGRKPKSIIAPGSRYLLQPVVFPLGARGKTLKKKAAASFLIGLLAAGITAT